MQIAGLIAFLLGVIIPAGNAATVAPPSLQDCPGLPPDGQQFAADITILSDRHGDAGGLTQCPAVRFTMNYSKIDLIKDYPDLRDQMATSAHFTSQPIEASVRGYMGIDPGSGGKMFFVTAIESWWTKGPPIPVGGTSG